MPYKTSSISPMRAMFVVTLAVLVITGIVSLAIDTTVTSSNKTDKQIVYVSFNIIGVMFAGISFLLMLLLLLICSDKYKPMMVSVIICTALSMMSYAVSVGVHSSIHHVPPIGWMMASLWVSVIGVIIAIVFLFSDPESI
ncbi:hypothetical protein D915_004158 [Fasciola hepatica]|uniref:Uncharacterized protein n=1 Tax=Fasciola hepatica TaxID=6192 RepID=A0A4E0RUU4_FASHE|nr:hypothetical protein D915_004158 [Fasciola hepatica]